MLLTNSGSLVSCFLSIQGVPVVFWFHDTPS
jgi:hypothetical protein